jgi:hypothetical protein
MNYFRFTVTTSGMHVGSAQWGGGEPWSKRVALIIIYVLLFISVFEPNELSNPGTVIELVSVVSEPSTW